ncbi:MAG TPA: hypothetical protein VMM92_09890 [Thermoanaerobaculia bacterium]|nr:hypothetical protein [Thermoanaerobaculia bacterium]
MRLSALDCMRRGLTNLWANRELVILQWLQGFAATLLLAVGLALPLAALGFDLAATDVLADPNRTLPEILPRAAGRLPSLSLALAGTLVLWLLAILLHCYVQAGTYGVLLAADRQALPGTGRSAGLFRTFSLRNFLGWAGLYGGRFFGFANFAGLLFLLWAAGLALWMGATLSGAAHWGETAALGIGCGGALPLAFAFCVLGLWYGVAQADLAREGSGVLIASRQGLEVIGSRLGAVLLVFALFCLALFVFLGGVSGIAFATDLLLAGQPQLRAAAQIGFTLLETLTQGLLLIALGGTLVALVRSETAREAGSQWAA